MDNQNTTPVTTTQPTQEVQPVPEPQSPQPMQAVTPPPAAESVAPLPKTSGGNKKRVLFIIIFLLLLAGASIAAYGLATQPAPQDTMPTKTVAIPTTVITPTTTPTAEEQELNAIDTGNPDSDFTSLQKDVNQL